MSINSYIHLASLDGMLIPILIPNLVCRSSASLDGSNDVKIYNKWKHEDDGRHTSKLPSCLFV